MSRWRVVGRPARPLVTVLIVAVLTTVLALADGGTVAAQDADQDTNLDVSIEERIFAGETSCEAPRGKSLTAEAAREHLPVTVCVYATNVGAGPTDIYLTSELVLQGERFFDVARGEAVVMERHVPFVEVPMSAPDPIVECERTWEQAAARCPDPRVRSYEMTLTQEEDPASYSNLLDQLQAANVVTQKQRNEWQRWKQAEAGLLNEELLDTQRNKWFALDLADYDFTYRVSVPYGPCNCPLDELSEEIRVQVRGGDVVSASPVDGEYAVQIKSMPTILDLFEEIDPHRRDDFVGGFFDRFYGLPLVTVVIPDHDVIEDQVLQYVSDFQPVVACKDAWQPVDEPCVSSNSCGARFVTEDLDGNRGNSVPRNTVQVVVFYDGRDHGEVEVRIGLEDGGWLPIGRDAPGGAIDVFGKRIETRQFDLGACALTGQFDIAGVTPNGVVDGVAIGVLWRDSAGGYTMRKSAEAGAVSGADFIGLWPLGFSGATFAERTDHISDPYGREVARAVITGAQLLDNGTYQFG